MNLDELTALAASGDLALMRKTGAYGSAVSTQRSEPETLRALLSLAREHQKMKEALDDVLANHMLASGIIAGMALKYERADMRGHAERMSVNVQRIRAALSPESKDSESAG